MIPVHVGIMTSTPTVMVPSVSVVSKPAVPKKDLAVLRAKDNEESGPTTTVFVGNISEKASDMLIRQLLAVRHRDGFTNFAFFILFFFHLHTHQVTQLWNIYLIKIVFCVWRLHPRFL